MTSAQPGYIRMPIKHIALNKHKLQDLILGRGGRCGRRRGGEGGACYFFLPSKERKTLGSGCGRLQTPVERRERARSAEANSGGGLADPPGLLMAAGSPTARRRLLEGFGREELKM